MNGFIARAYRRSSDPMLRGLCLGQIGLTVAMVLVAFFTSAFENRFTAYYYWAVSGLAVALARADGMPSGKGLLRRLLRANGVSTTS